MTTRTHRFHMTTTAAIAAACSVAALSSGGQLRYRAVLLDQPDQGNTINVLGINDNDTIVGSAGSGLVSIGTHASVWTDASLNDIDPLFDLSDARVINNAGYIAGEGTFCPPVDGACDTFIARALPGGELELIGAFGPNGSVMDINSQGDFVGWWYNEDFQRQAFLHTEKGGLVNLGNLDGFSAEAVAINDAGLIAGTSYTADLQQHAFLINDGVMIDLGTLGGSFSKAYDMNEHGTIIGVSRTPGGADHAFRVEGQGPDLAMTNIMTLPDAVSSTATVINDNGTIAGLWNDGEGDRLFMWTEAGGTVDLGQPPVDNLLAIMEPTHLNNDNTLIVTALSEFYEPSTWIYTPETGLQSLDDAIVNTDDFTLGFNIGGINARGVIAAAGTITGTFETVAARLEPVAEADLNADGVVSVADLLQLLAAWGECSGCIEDITNDNTVGVMDLLELLNAWG